MTIPWDTLTILVLLAAAVLMLFLLLRRQGGESRALAVQLEKLGPELERLERGLREELGRGRQENADHARGQREELAAAIQRQNDTLARTREELVQVQQVQLEAFAGRLEQLTKSLQEQDGLLRLELQAGLKHFGDFIAEGARTAAASQEQQLTAFGGRLELLMKTVQDQNAQLRLELQSKLKTFGDFIADRTGTAAAGQEQQLAGFARQLAEFAAGSEKKLEAIRETLERQLLRLGESAARQQEEVRRLLEEKLQQIQEENRRKLEEMRQTVDEKLQGTLEKRLGESFKQVSDRLEQVHRGLGEMQTLAAGVGDLKKVLSNVKTRGTWGEIQLGSLLEQVLSPEQYEANVAVQAGHGERVEFAIRLPGREGEAGSVVWLPVDAKFPQEDYQRLVEAADASDAVRVEAAARQLEIRIRASAQDIRTKYIHPPATTDFAIMFLPTEGLYAEVIRRPGLVESLQQDQRVVVAGPATLAALLNSLQMGFRTLAIQRRSGEVWKVLGAVKAEFGKFGEVLSHVKTKLDQASSTIEKAEVRTRAISRQLREVEVLPAAGEEEPSPPALREDPDLI